MSAKGTFLTALAVMSLVLSPLPAAGNEALQTTPVGLRLVWIDLCDTAPQLRHGALREIQALLKPVGLRVTGRSAVPGESGPTGGLYVVLMPFHPSQPRTRSLGGVAQKENGRQLSVWAFPPMVAGGLGLDLGQTSRWTHRNRQQFQRALAVVVVHELAHAFIAASHRPDGLMAPQLGREQLLDPELVVDADLHPAFLAAVARLDVATDPQGQAVRVAASTRSACSTTSFRR